MREKLKAPFPYFGGKSLACSQVWAALGDPENYVEPFAGSAAMLLGRPSAGKVETINDADGFVANFWRAVSKDAAAVAAAADWPVNEVDLFSRHSWLLRQRSDLLDKLHADPDFFDAKIAGWWCWGACAWIGSGWCSGEGPWVHNGEKIVDSRKLPHLGNAGQGVNRKLPHLGNAGQGVNRITDGSRRKFIFDWMVALQSRLRSVRVTCGDWSRTVKDSLTVRHGLTAVFLDPPYAKGAMNYSAGGMGLGIADDVRAWCAANGGRTNLRIVLCGHAGEHDELLKHGWTTRRWNARNGYAKTEEARANYQSETLWCSPNCVQESGNQGLLL